jgi:Txe/YoeB family toxin of toxin-antitoxin system
MYKLYFTKQAEKDYILLKRAGYGQKVNKLLKIIKENPYQNPPMYEKLTGIENYYSRRINQQHRLVYEVLEQQIKIHQLWTHYENM